MFDEQGGICLGQLQPARARTTRRTQLEAVHADPALSREPARGLPTFHRAHCSPVSLHCPIRAVWTLSEGLTSWEMRGKIHTCYIDVGN